MRPTSNVLAIKRVEERMAKFLIMPEVPKHQARCICNECWANGMKGLL